MNTILTDDDIKTSALEAFDCTWDADDETLVNKYGHGTYLWRFTDFARAIEAAVLAKLRVQVPQDERAAFEAWWKGDLLDYRGHNNTAALHAWEGWQARAMLAAAPQPAVVQVPAPWREAVKVAREALMEAVCVAKWPELQFKQFVVQGLEAALAQLDSLEGEE